MNKTQVTMPHQMGKKWEQAKVTEGVKKQNKVIANS
jgi:hypothetical protein